MPCGREAVQDAPLGKEVSVLPKPELVVLVVFCCHLLLFIVVCYILLLCVAIWYLLFFFKILFYSLAVWYVLFFIVLLLLLFVCLKGRCRIVTGPLSGRGGRGRRGSWEQAFFTILYRHVLPLHERLIATMSCITPNISR